MILVVGAGGSLGGRIVRGLIARGEAVRALVRSDAARQTLARDGATAVLGDVRDQESLERACDGVSAVVTTASPLYTANDLAKQLVDSRARLLLTVGPLAPIWREALQGTGVERVVTFDAPPAGPSAPRRGRSPGACPACGGGRAPGCPAPPSSGPAADPPGPSR